MFYKGFIKQAELHHNVYVVELAKEARKHKKLQQGEQGKELLYVGSTGLPVETRFQNHKKGVKGNNFVTRYGVKLRPDLFEKYNPMTFADAEAKEIELAKQLRQEGYSVIGGNG
jgi:hypothetical protein